MKNNYSNSLIREISIGIILVILLLVILNPFHAWMPSMLSDVILAVLFVTFCGFAAYLLQEKVADEREDRHRMLSGRLAFLSGSAMLIIGIIVKEWSGKSDPWLFLALVVMIIVKIGVRAYTDHRY